MFVPVGWLKEYVECDVSPQELASIITMGGIEVEEISQQRDDTVLTLAPTPNRGDCLSILGVAIEVAALLNKKVKFPKISPPKGKGKMSETVDVIVKDARACPRYTSRVVTGVKIARSPDWLRKKLEAACLRSINNVVDATNYVLMELGQPVHAFDIRFLSGNKLIIDKARSKCELVALDGVKYQFTEGDILNFDGAKPIGVAGIMGGENSGVVDDTTTLVLESAYFDPISVRRTSKRTGLSSESSKRFEKGVDPDAVILALHRLTELIVELSGGTPSADFVDIYPKPFVNVKIELKVEDVNRLLGTNLDAKKISKILESIGCNVDTSANSLKADVPKRRPDLTRPVDLIEEVARLYGYNNISDSLPMVRVSSIVKPPAKDAERQACEALIGYGFFEAKTYSFASDAQLKDFGGLTALKLSNPLTADTGSMRRLIFPSLLSVLKGNLNRQIIDAKLFEINRVFIPEDGKLPQERQHLSGVMTGIMNPGRWDGSEKAVDLFDAKAVIYSICERLGLSGMGESSVKDRSYLHPRDSFEVLLENSGIGFCGRLHPQIEKKYDFAAPVYVFELDLGSIKEACLKVEKRYKAVSRYPFITRDVALLVNSVVTHKELLQSFNKKLNKLVQCIELFDIYEGKGIPEGKKSMAYRIAFSSDDRTLSDEEVDKAFTEMVTTVKNESGAEVR